MTSQPVASEYQQVRWLLLMVGLIVALTSISMAGAARPASKARGLIAFTRYDGIYVMRPDGSGVHALRRGGVAADAQGLAWSPNGRKLAFSADNAIWVMNADGTRLVRVVKADMTYSPTWSPDGGTIAFTQLNGMSGEDVDRDVWSVNPDGSGLSQLTDLPDQFEYDVDWSPTANRIAFATGGWVGAVYERSLGRSLLEDGTVLRLLTQPKYYSYQPDWSPNGRRIVFTRHLRSGSGQLFVINLADGAVKKLTGVSAPAAVDPAWSPDGHKIVFVRGDQWLVRCLYCSVPKRSQGEIYVMNADGTGLTRLTHNRLGEGSPAWQPVGIP